MKKILLFLLLIILIPLIVVNIFFKEKEIKFHYIENVKIRVKNSDGNIENINFEDYLTGVLAGEMPVSFELEALKAQAVAARTYAYKKLDPNAEYDVVDTVDNQVYKSYEYLQNVWNENYIEYINKLKTAVIETSGEYIMYNNELIDAFYFSTSNGKTENGRDVFGIDAPYLISVDSKWDSISPAYSTQIQISSIEFFEKLGITKFVINNVEKNESGSINNITIDNKRFTGIKIRELLNLKSTFFDITQSDNTINITNKGYGHGVGMSQYGAQAMALNGAKYDEILKYYYQNIKIKKK